MLLKLKRIVQSPSITLSYSVSEVFKAWSHTAHYSLVQEHVHEVIVRELVQIVDLVQRVGPLVQNHSRHTLRPERRLAIGVLGVTSPLVARHDPFEHGSAVGAGRRIDDALDVGLGHDAVTAPGLVGGLVDRAREYDDEFGAGCGLLVESRLESFGFCELSHHFVLDLMHGDTLPTFNFL